MPRRARPEPPRASVQLAIIGGIGFCVGVPATLLYSPVLGPLLGWDATALVYLVWAWRTFRARDWRETAALAVREDPNRAIRDVALLAAGLASLLAIGLLLISARSLSGFARDLHVGVGIVSVLLSWATVHTIFTARYARLYYTGPDGGVDFHDPEPPRYSDFAYLAFTVGMTFQVSDTNVTAKDMRTTVLAHALLSYLFGAVIIAATVNLLAGLVN